MASRRLAPRTMPAYHQNVATALVLSAGGLYAAWEVGVWKAHRGRFQPDLIVGASAGAWNGWAIASGCSIEELTDTWLDPLTGSIMQPSLRRCGLFLPEMLHRKARELFDRFRPRLPFGLTLVEVPRLHPKLVHADEVRWEHLAATCSIPLCFPAVRIGARKYVDGGVAGALPLWAAERMGAGRAIAADVLNIPPFRTLRRVLPLPRHSADMDIIRIEPSVKLGRLRDAVRWSRGNILQWIELGERDANRAFTSITM